MYVYVHTHKNKLIYTSKVKCVKHIPGPGDDDLNIAEAVVGRSCGRGTVSGGPITSFYCTIEHENKPSFLRTKMITYITFDFLNFYT